MEENHHTTVDDDNDDDNDSLERQKETVLSLLKDAIKGNVLNTTTRSRQKYEDRLLTFRASTYCAKPECLSPVICARFGWSNVDEDMLVCSSCKAALAVVIPSGLSTNVVVAISKKYRKKLATAHDPNCPFRLDAEQFLLRQEEDSNSNNEDITIPTHFAPVLDPESLELIEHSSPCSLLRDRVRKLEETCRPSQEEQTRWTLPELAIDTILRDYGKDANGESDGRDSIARVSSILGKDNYSGIALTILGWTPVQLTYKPTPLDTISPSLTLVCPICLSFMDLPLKKVKEDDDLASDKKQTKDSCDDSKQSLGPSSQPPAKRLRSLRTRNPLSAHRHYCPFVCGFPTNSSKRDTPLWRKLLSRVFEEEETKRSLGEPEQNTNAMSHRHDFDGIRKLLRLGIGSSSRSRKSITNGD